jgi:peptidylprolyl isomerase
VVAVGGLACVVGLGLAGCGGHLSASAGHSRRSAGAPTSTAAEIPVVEHARNLSEAPVVRPDDAPPPTKLLTRNLVVGTGGTATRDSTVVVRYVGADYRTGKVFNTTWTSGQVATFPLSQVIPGFAEGIEGMKVGGRREIVIPWTLGYGASGNPPVIAPKETLVFVVDLVALS